MTLFTKKFIAIVISIAGFAINSFSTSYVSAGAGPSNWNSSSTWTPAGVPLATDDVTILAGHTVTANTSANICRNLIVNGTLNLAASLTIKGNYTVNATGVETGVARITFSATTCTITALGTIGIAAPYSFNCNVIVTTGSTIDKTNGALILGVGKTFVNNGTLTFKSFTGKTGSSFTNAANSTLTLKAVGFMSGATFTATATGNTVRLNYTTGAVPTTVSSTFYNLSFISTTAGAKTLAANTIVLNNLSISSTNTVNSNNFNLTVGGNWTNSGTFTATAAKTVTLNGTSAQSVSNTVGTTTFKRLTISNINGVTLTTGTYILDEVLTVTDGTFNTGGRPFTMTSTATQTARIAPITGTGAISGNFTVQRFIATRDTTFADLASPVQFSTFSDWDTDFPVFNYTNSPPTSYASANTYDESSDTYVPVTSSGTAINAGVGYEVFLSGAAYADFPTTTMNTVGTPNQGDFDLSSLISNNSQGWNLVGNPFASSISWTSIYNDAGTSGLYDFIEMYDNTIHDWSGFTTADAIEIGSTQGFWVYGLNPSVSLNIPESAKTTTSNSSIKTAAIKQAYFTLKLGSRSSSAAHIFKIAANDVANDGLDTKDIPFRASPDYSTPQMYCVVDGKKININNFNSSNDSYSIPLKTKVNVSGNYKIEAAGFEFIDYTCVKLQDNLTGELVNLSEGNGYCITINASDNEDRFVLHFSKDNSCKALASANTSSDFSSQVDILPSDQGNVVNFNLGETIGTSISVVNVLGQTVIEPISLEANNQSVNITLPEGFSGLYIIKVESQKGAITKKFVKK